MRVRRLAALAGAVFILGAGPAPATLQNGGFEETDAGGLIEWRLSAGLAAYTAAQDPAGHTGHALVLRRKPEGEAGFGSAAQTISAIPYRGQRIRFRAWVRTEVKPGAQGGLWMRVDLTHRMSSFFDNMTDRPIVDPTWRAYQLEAYVPRDAQFISVGAILIGDGKLWLDEASVEVVDAAPDTSGRRLSRPAKAYLDKAIDLLRANHINAARADWAGLRREAYAAAGAARTPADTYPAIELVIGELGEKHTYFRRPQPDSPAPPAGAAPAAAVDDGNRLPEVERSGRVGIVTIPSLSTYSEAQIAFSRRYVTTLHDFFRGADADGICGWIVDLRENYGGNMWPMLNGLRPILDDGPFGAFNSPMLGSHLRWLVIGGQSIGTEGQATEALDWPRIAARTAPVAVLVGPHTTSSGEMTAIAFRGRPDTRSFGQPTAGYTTANEPMPMADGASLVVTSAYVEDRNGVAFTGPLPPDEVVALDKAPDAARAWLATKGCPVG